MAEPFNAAPLTTTFLPVPNAGLDNHINIKGSSANWGSITSDTFLPGPKPAIDQTFIKGHQSVKVNSNRMVDIVGNLNTKIDALETHDVLQGRTANITVYDNCTVTGVRNETVTSSYFLTVNETLNETIKDHVSMVNGQKLETTVGATTENEVSDWREIGPGKFTWYWIGKHDLTTINTEINAIKVGVTGYKDEIAILDTKLEGIEAKWSVINATAQVAVMIAGVAKGIWGGICNKFEGFGS